MANLGFTLEHEKETWHLSRATRFPERILTSIYGSIDNIPDELYEKIKSDDRIKDEYVGRCSPKDHTIRPKSDNIKEGGNIHFLVGNRTSKRFQFAEIMPCTKKEDISFRWTDNGRGLRRCQITIEGYKFPEVYINGGIIITISDDVKKLISRDGFDEPRQFFHWFGKDGDFEIIHWTDRWYSKEYIDVAHQGDKSEFEKTIEKSIDRSKEEE